MSALHIFLFGQFHVQCSQQTCIKLESKKAQELLCYLLLNRTRSHPREVLADLLWSDSSTIQSKKYLRKVLWQIQTSLDFDGCCFSDRILLTEPDWIQINPELDLWLDVAVFEQTFASVQGLRGRELSPQSIQDLERAVTLYQGNLLEGCYQDWCIYERELYQHMYLVMLDKLMDHCEMYQKYELGLSYGMSILRYDRARERTHRHLMWLYFLSGNRAAALRQYKHCQIALTEELDVRPSKLTLSLYEKIKADELTLPSSQLIETSSVSERMISRLINSLECIKNCYSVLAESHHQIQQDIQALESALGYKE